MVNRFLIAFGGEVCRVDYSHPEVEELLLFLFGDMAVPDTDNDKICAHYVIGYEACRWSVCADTMSKREFDEIDALGNFLSGDILFRLIEPNEGHLAIHAGLVSKANKSLLIPAESGSGKTSVTAWLISKGWCYHTDELVLIDLQHGKNCAFSRPLNIKSKGRAAVEELLSDHITNTNAPELIRHAAGITMIHHTAFPQGVREHGQHQIPPVSRIIFPNYSDDKCPELIRLSAAAAGLELMRSNVIARNLPGHGFADIVKVVKKTPAYLLHYNHFDDLPALFQEIDNE